MPPPPVVLISSCPLGHSVESVQAAGNWRHITTRDICQYRAHVPFPGQMVRMVLILHFSELEGVCMRLLKKQYSMETSQVTMCFSSASG